MLHALEKENNTKNSTFYINENESSKNLDLQSKIHQMLNSINLSSNSKIFTSLDNLHNVVHKKN